MIEDYCDFFSSVERDPEAMVEGWTVREYLLARQHLAICTKCQESADRVVEKFKKEDKDGIEFGLN